MPAPGPLWAALETDHSVMSCVLRSVFPDLVLSAAMHVVLQLIICRSCLWDLLCIALSPLLLSPFLDVRYANKLRGVNEVAWIVQAHVILLILSKKTYLQIQRSAILKHYLSPLLLFMWVTSFSQVYVVLTRPEYIYMSTRNILTCSMFAFCGMLLYARKVGSDPFFDQIQFIKGLLPWVFFVIVFALLCFYLHHVDTSASNAQPNCFSISGGTPCLWVIDSCASRWLPLLMLALAWLTDCGRSFPSSLFGPLDTRLASTLQHVNGVLVRCEKYNCAWLLYAKVFAMAVHWPLTVVLREAHMQQFASVIVLGELLIVTAAIYAFKRLLTSVLDEPLTALVRTVRAL